MMAKKAKKSDDGKEESRCGKKDNKEICRGQEGYREARSRQGGARKVKAAKSPARKPAAKKVVAKLPAKKPGGSNDPLAPAATSVPRHPISLVIAITVMVCSSG
jgi:hypothetical protein